MTRRIVGIAASLVLAAGLARGEEAGDWKTRAEATAYRETATYSETLDYLRRVEAKNPQRVKVGFFGKSGEGRDIPYVVVDRDGKFTPAEIRKTGRVVVMIQSGIHAGEIDGKDASLALIRELAVTHSLSGMLTNVSIVFVPIYNVDGHEKRSPYNRINQNGPKEMGFRTNAVGLDLNRDYLKLDSSEARALVSLYSLFEPDFFVDCHVTDGADFRYDVTYAWQPWPAAPKPIAGWCDTNLPRVFAEVESKGHLTAPYIVLKDEGAPEKGMEGGAATPRFSTGYTPLKNRPSLLVETHVYKDYKTRVVATYDVLVAVLRVVFQQHELLRGAIAKMDAVKTEWGAKYDPAKKVALSFATEPEGESFLFKTWESKNVRSEATGGLFTVYTRDPKDVVIPYFSKIKPEIEVVRPVGYLIPPSRGDVAEKLRLHGLTVRTLDAPVSGEFEMYRAEQPTFRSEPYQGRHPVTAKIVPVRETRSYPAGSYYVPLAQRWADVAIRLLEPQDPDSLFSWGFFDSIFERKEYFETSVIEKYAAQMLAENPKTREELDKKRRDEPAFAADPAAIREWVYRRTPYYDESIGLYPIARVTTQEIPAGKN